MKDGFIKAAAAVPKVCVANPADNAREILRLIREAVGRKVRILAFPELSLTGYTCGDLFLQEQLLKMILKQRCDLSLFMQNGQM